MRRGVLILIAGCAAACDDPTAPAANSSGERGPLPSPHAASASGGTESATPSATAPQAPAELAPIEASPLAPTASETERVEAVLTLLAGGEPATRLAVRATDADRAFDPDLRDRVAPRRKPPSLRMGPTSISEGLAPEIVHRIVRQKFGRFRLCYEDGLQRNPRMTGVVRVAFTIQPDGTATAIKATGAGMDEPAVSCVDKAFHGLAFPAPAKGLSVTVTYPINFAPPPD